MKYNSSMKILKIIGVFLLILFFIIIISGTWAYFYLSPKFEISNTKSIDGITSILILGKGSDIHTASDLTDTMMLLTINHSAQAISLLSIPRDIWIPEMRAKINSAYYWDKERQNKNNEYLYASTEYVTGIKPNYVAIIDFDMFKELIDAVGGIDVYMENGFIDKKYPIAGKENDLCDGDRTYACRYEVLQFSQGLQKLNGEMALKFARSRNSEGDEGTDLARERRQQKIFEALKIKMTDSSVILSKNTINNLYEVLMRNLDTDLTIDEFLPLIPIFLTQRGNLNTFTVPEEMLRVSTNNPLYDRQYVFLPKGDSWKDLHNWIKDRI